MAGNVATFTDQNWQSEVMASPQPVLVDFWAEWCVPCRTLAPIVEAVAASLGPKVRVGKMNVEDNADVPVRYNITTLPTLLVIKGGMVAEQRVGLLTKDALVKLLLAHI